MKAIRLSILNDILRFLPNKDAVSVTEDAMSFFFGDVCELHADLKYLLQDHMEEDMACRVAESAIGSLSALMFAA